MKPVETKSAPFSKPAGPPPLTISPLSPDGRPRIPGNLILPPTRSIPEYLTSQLSVERLNNIHLDLWWAGRPENIRGLHAQKMLKREITISERIELHLFWFESIIFIKPLPAWMLDWDFCNAHICTDRDLYELVNGWLRSYTKLIQYPSDFVIAKKLGLLPERIRTWDEWSDLSIALQMRIDNSIVNKRYYYGELRLRRLNHIYLFLRAFDTYHYIHQRHKPFFSEKFGRLLLFLVYLTTILSVLQVVVSTQHTPEKLGDFSYWFGLVSVAIIFFFCGSPVAAFCYELFVAFCGDG
jgi:hypothetical protein